MNTRRLHILASPYFLHFFQSNTTVCLIIHILFKSCEPKIVFVLICLLQNDSMFTYLTKCLNHKCCALEILKKISICLMLAVIKVKSLNHQEGKKDHPFILVKSQLLIQCNPDLVTHLVCQKTVAKSRGVTK